MKQIPLTLIVTEGKLFLKQETELTSTQIDVTPLWNFFKQVMNHSNSNEQDNNNL